ncbi:MAG: hypothetical protein KIS64_09365, partial [Fimbriimonadaceae bacterium]|nr:hypothetical protein [Fimbriimonadaceae bacterium]
MKISAGESHLHSCRLTAQGAAEEEVLDAETFPWNGSMLVPHANLVVDLDSLHWQHGQTVTFRVYASAGGETAPPEQLVHSETRTVYNIGCLVWDSSAAYQPNIRFVPSVAAIHALGYGTAQNELSKSWTRNGYLSKLSNKTVHYVLTHGGAYGSGDGHLIPPGGGGHVTKDNVPPALPGPDPITKFVYIAGCEAGVNANFPLAYLSEAAPPYVNRCVVAWKIKPFNVTAQDLW